MKNVRVTIFLNALTLLMVGLMLCVPRVSAAADCFTDTNDHWAEKFICWLKEKGISSGFPDGSYRPDQGITRGEMAVMLQRQAEVPPTTGTLLVNVPGGEWQLKTQTDDLPSTIDQLVYEPEALWIRNVGIVNEDFVLSPSLPSALYSQSFQLTGFEFCHSGENNIYLDMLSLSVVRNSNGISSTIAAASDATDRAVTECRSYALNSPVVLTADDTVSLEVNVDIKVVPVHMELGRVTFILQATGTTAALPKEAAENVTVLEMLEQ